MLALSQRGEYQEEVALSEYDDFSQPSLYPTSGEFLDLSEEIVYLEGTVSVTF